MSGRVAEDLLDGALLELEHLFEEDRVDDSGRVGAAGDEVRDQVAVVDGCAAARLEEPPEASGLADLGFRLEVEEHPTLSRARKAGMDAIGQLLDGGLAACREDRSELSQKRFAAR